MQISRLNMDNSWMIQFGDHAILVDPWLIGAEVDFFPWFNKQWHRTAPIKLEDVPDYDTILITQKYPDHYHEETLKALNPSKLIVPKSIYQNVKELLPHAEVKHLEQELDGFLGGTINLHYLKSKRRIDPIYEAIVLENGDESVLLATHGYTEPASWYQILKKLPPVKLAFSPFNLYKLPFFLGGTVSPGLKAVRKLIEDLNPQYIIATHDEDKHATGLVNRLAKITKSPSSKELTNDPTIGKRLLTIDTYQPMSI